MSAVQLAAITIHAAWPASAGTERSDAPALRLAKAAVDARAAIIQSYLPLRNMEAGVCSRWLYFDGQIDYQLFCNTIM